MVSPRPTAVIVTGDFEVFDALLAADVRDLGVVGIHLVVYVVVAASGENVSDLAFAGNHSRHAWMYGGHKPPRPTNAAQFVMPFGCKNSGY